jgi:upstream activation factor subunit UAF30
VNVAVKAPKTVKKAKASATETVVPVVAAPAETVTEVDSLEASIIEQSTEFNAKLQQLASLISSLKSEYKGLEKKWQRELKAAQKQSSKRKRKSGNRAPSGFVKPTRISDELASFLGKDKGTEMARTAVTRDINAYIRTNNLQDKANGRQINPDAKLAALLKLQKTDVLTYFNLQKYMSPHFAKSVKAEAAAAAATA